MKKTLLLTLALGAFALQVQAQSVAVSHLIGPSKAVRAANSEVSPSRSASSQDMEYVVLPASVAIPGTDLLPIAGKYDYQTNGRGLHNIQVDPDNPQHIHATIMTVTANTDVDTNNSAFPSRRTLYTYSSDGGSHWTTPVIVGGSKLRTGYPSMVLMKRNGVNVPVIAVHRDDPNMSGGYIVSLFVEQGAPGTGNFSEIDATDIASDGVTKSLLWPAIAVPPGDNPTKVYVIADFSDQADAKAVDYMEFGSFTIGAEGTGTFDGWLSEPGGGSKTDGLNSGWSSAGKHVIRVADDGTIGVSWINTYTGDNDNGIAPDHGLYFVESKDGGVTWPASYKPVIPSSFLQFDPETEDDLNRGIAPNNGLDFFYNNNIPHFMVQMDAQIMGLPDSDGYYFPYTGALAYYSPAHQGLQILNHSSDIITLLRDTLNGGSSADTVYYLYNSADSYFDPAAIPTGIEFPSPSSISDPTIAHTTDPNVWSVYYSTIQNNDFSTIASDDGSTTQTEWYGAIYSQTTTDNGATWSAPTLFKGNTDQTPSDQLVDYRNAEVSDFNLPTAAGANYQIMFSADTLPGKFGGGGKLGYDYNYWFHQSLDLSKVENNIVSSGIKLNASYPNPFASSTKISFELSQPSNVVISVSDVMGRPVATILNQHLSNGPHSVDFSAAHLPAGSYTYTLNANGKTLSRTMTILK